MEKWNGLKTLLEINVWINKDSRNESNTLKKEIARIKINFTL